MENKSDPVPQNEKDDDNEPEVVQIESFCVNCHANGITRMMLTKIPFYRDVVVMSFCCDECGYENNELKICGVISEKGNKFSLTVNSSNDLNRKCVRTEHAIIRIPEVDLEITPQNQKGEVTTIESIINRAVIALQQDQAKRRVENPDDAEKIHNYCFKLNKLKHVEENGPFTFIIEDISGNSHIENFVAPLKDPNLNVSYFDRTPEQNHELGLFSSSEVIVYHRKKLKSIVNEDTDDERSKKIESIKDTLLQPIGEGEHTLEKIEQGEVLTFRTNCPDCNAPCDTNMKMTDIPHFKEVVIMATFCEQCGHRTNEVKGGSGIEDMGIRIEVKIENKQDFTRDILKSDTCSLSIPELELESGPRSLCGRFTTAEGIINSVKDQLAGEGSMFFGDSTDPATVNRIEIIISKLSEVLKGTFPITLILDDPAGNSYVQTLNDDGTTDDRLNITKYIRNYDQNEELGLNDMKTEDY